MGNVNTFFITFFVITLSRNLSFCFEPLKKDPNHNRCTSDFNCTTHAYCHPSGICQCKANYVPDRVPNIPGKKAYHTVCLREALFIGDHCKKDIQCKTILGLHSKCFFSGSNNQLGSCQCTKEAHYKDGTCHKTSLIGERCEVNGNCYTRSMDINAYCASAQCICPPKYCPTVDLKDCQPCSELGGRCLDDAGCTNNENSGCIHGFCRCKQQFVTGKNNICLPLADKLEDDCEVDDQCSVSLQNTRCDGEKHVCVCDNDSHFVDGKCWKTVRFLEPCQYNPECIIEKGPQNGITCKEGLCQCKDGFVMEEQSYCLKENGTETNTGHRIPPEILIYSGLLIIIQVISFK
ncbi:prion-like-(Q/N-rich) domain-bearing protein 25 [Halyomorpha halys]|uniref:prion-like-(Q/N-rich) domain-bearing protein 25 n=1 Tax=Halyomorpha halys TaxID=286706 RepID=UPI0006D5209D|nr:multiple epidermal growth factor-like domains protein 10 [Halyomorpha halys]XP_014283489.1 multiple epidermal growth factor-like domains protein 10 [Halyomorpha halys]XP_024215324.1 multiple epidermal growth factor-like domains protein 10 [Halyomorpha halys]